MEANAKAESKILGAFSGDSAYKFVAEQIEFGPRVPGTPQHQACRDYLVSKFRQYCDSVVLQDATVTAFNGDVLPITNIIGGFNTTKERRILLAAHWDTRPWADQEDSVAGRKKPVLGANDGGSGVAVLVEIARNLQAKKPEVGVDLILFDAEDYGNHDGGFDGNEESWCLGSQYWTENIIPYGIGNLPVYGILLDMVGGNDARFNYEAFSVKNASVPTIKVWSEAEALGHVEMFPRTIGGIVTDDHIYLTRAGIPTTDIIELNNVETSSFPPTWHTLKDNLDGISKSTLQAVGETVLNVIYKEKSI